MLYPWDPMWLRADEVVCAFSDWMIQVDVGLENLPGMQSFDLDFPSGLNSYITAPQLGDYMIQYVDHFNLRRFFRRSVNSVNAHNCYESNSTGIRMTPYMIFYDNIINMD